MEVAEDKVSCVLRIQTAQATKTSTSHVNAVSHVLVEAIFANSISWRRLGPDSDGKADGDDMGCDGLADMDPSLKTNSVKCAKEKNRQAQRRFRERQKCLIQALKDRTDTLQKQVSDLLACTLSF